MNQNLKLIVSSIAAGVAISIGGISYLKTDMPWLFPIGLFIVCFFNLHLFTGRICYYSPKNRNLHEFIIVYLFNSLSAYFIGIATRLAVPSLAEKAEAIAERKMSENLLALMLLAILCNVLIFVAVDSYKRSGKFLGLIFATTIFVACGFEHCIANAFYFGVAGICTLDGWFYLLINAIWNAIGGIMTKRVLYMTKGETTA